MGKTFGVVVCLAVAAGIGVGLFAAIGTPAGAQPAARAAVEYKALVRTDIEDMAPEKVRKNGHLEGSNAEALAAGLNLLAKDGWELAAVEPDSEQQTKTPQGAVTFRHYPTYVFKRPK
jgi:hypothetical protein